MSDQHPIDDQSRKVDVRRCARCGDDHDGLTFKKFKGQPIFDEQHVWNYWTICPNTGDPILLLVQYEQ